MIKAKFFCITLPESTNRERAAAEFARCGLDVQFWNGINGLTFGLKTFLPSHHDWFTSPKIIGINLAHWILWRCMEFLTEDAFVVFEDDVGLHPDFTTLWPEITGQLPSDWQMVHIGACCVRNNPYSKYTTNLIKARNPMGTHAYMIKREILPILIENCASVKNPVDQEIVFSVIPKIRHYTMMPSLATQINNECFRDSGWCF